MPGSSLKKWLQKSHPFKERKCRDMERCIVCGDGEGGMCRRDGVTYEVRCKGCEGRYVGETSRNAFTRGFDQSQNQRTTKAACWHISYMKLTQNIKIKEHSNMISHFVPIQFPQFSHFCPLFTDPPSGMIYLNAL